MQIAIERLTAAYRDEAVVVLSDAFRDYPVMRHVLSDAGRHYEEHLWALNDYFCSRRLVHGGLVLGAMVDGELAGVSGFDAPGDLVDEDQQREWTRALVRDIGEEAVARLSKYDQVGEALMPSGDYHYLGMLGVLARHQGLGLGKGLVEATMDEARESPISTGVCLHTETPDNVPLYEHLGFEVIGEAEVDGLRTWCMFAGA
jgi:GNAT superfamily N-acetyltransferase